MTGAEAGAVLRIARRTAWRQRWRTLLVVLLVAAPVAIAGATAAIMRASDLTPAERATQAMGAAELQVEAWGGHPGEATAFVDAQLDRPDVGDVTRVRETWVHVGTEYTRVSDLDLGSPVAAGMMELVEGRAPSEPGQVALTPQLARDLDAGIGDVVSLGVEDAVVEVVGVLEDSAEVRSRTALTTPAGFDRLEAAGVIGSDAGHGARWLVATEAPAVVARDLQDAAQEAFGARLEEQQAAMEAEQVDVLADDVPEAGAPQIAARTRAEVTQGWTDTSLAQTLWRPETVATGVAALLLIEVVFIAGAAYATGTRRRLRELGLLASGGATVGHLRAVVVLEAAVTGLAGAGVGVVLGAGAVALGRPTLQRFVGPRIDGLPLGSLDLLGPVVVAVVAVVAAAWLPARTAARVPTTTALQGRMPLSAPPRWLSPAGIALALFGGLLAVVGFAGDSDSSGAVAVIGVGLTVVGTAVLTGPIVAALGERADRLPATLRLVVRDAARQRTRAAAATSAALVLLLIPIALGVAYATSATQSRLFGLPEPPTHVVVGDEQLVYAFGPYGDGGASVAGVGDPDPSLIDEVSAQMGNATVQAPVTLVADGEDRFAWILDEGLETSDEVVPGDGGYEATVPNGVVPSARTMTMARATPELVEVLEDGLLADALDRDGVVVLGARSRSLSVRLPDGAAHTATEVPVPVPASGGFPRVLLSDEVASQVGVSTVGTVQLLVASAPLDDATRMTLQNLAETSGDGQAVQVAWGGGDPGWAPWAVGGVSLLVVLVVLGLVTALSATESDNDLGTMVAVGAHPSLRRRFLGLQSLLYTVVGGVLAVPLGIGLNWATQAGRQYVQIGPFGTWHSGRVAVPWWLLAALVVGIPLVNGLVTALGVRSTRPQPPRRIA